MNIIIIGAGASGLTAAISLKRRYSCEITIIEGSSVPGKKILLTGNGKCNLANLNTNQRFFNGDPGLVSSVMQDYSTADDMDFLRSIGIYPANDGSGRLYPGSMQAKSCVQLLYAECLRLGVNFIFDTLATSIEKSTEGYTVNKKFHCHKLIITTGGFASPKTGSDGSMLNLLANMGVKFTPVAPALVALIPDKKYPYCLKGIRAKCKATLYIEGKIIDSDTGEVQFNEKSISGIPIMQLSGRASRALLDHKKVQLCLNKLPDEQNVASIIHEIIRRNPDMPAEDAFSGLLNPKLYHDDLKTLGVKSDDPVKNLQGKIPQFVSLLTSMKINIVDTAGMQNAQVSSGGIPYSQVNTDTMELKRLQNVYVAGEILDVDGLCGGYNLMWARQSARKIKLC